MSARVRPDRRPLIGVPMGDPAGIGPEIVVRAALDEGLARSARMVVVGDLATLELAREVTGVALELRAIESPEQAEPSSEVGVLHVIQQGALDREQAKFGVVSAACGRASYDYVVRVTELALAGRVDAIATTPINKQALRAAQVDFIGHTEMLASLTGTADPLTMFQVRNLIVFFLTRHLSLVDAMRAITPQRVHDYLVRCSAALEQLGFPEPTIAVAAINPHAGEQGLFGDEEQRSLAPGVELAVRDGIAALGPKPADSVFHFALEGRYDAVLSAYHDQGHIATKMVDFHRTIAITAGMPILRTSVDHGTAMDVAGQGLASAVSMVEAIRLAAHYAPRFASGAGC